MRGRVQGVGFRWFVQKWADKLGIGGYTRNLDDGSVEVYAIGPLEKLNELSGLLRTGPRMAEVRGVDEEEAEMQTVRDFEIR